MLKISNTSLVAILFIFSNIQSAVAACNISSRADTLLNNMVKNYQILLKYNDKGTVTSKIGGINHVQEFKTYYEAPDKFRFQWSEENPYTNKRRLHKL